MTDLTASALNRESVDPKRLGHEVANTVQSFAGALGALAGNLAAANQGFAVAGYDNLVGIIPLGGAWSDEKLGDTTSTTLPDPENNATIQGRVLRDAAVTGATNNATDLGKVVFNDSNGPPYLLADPGNALPLGVVINVSSAGIADLYMFGFETLCVLGLLTRTVYAAGAGGDFSSWGTDVGNP